METEIILGKILEAVRAGAKTFKEVELRTELSANTITKYTHFLEEEGLLVIKPDKDRRKIIYQLNDSRIKDIEALIQKYIEFEVEEVEKKFLLIVANNLEKAKDLLKRLEKKMDICERLRKHGEPPKGIAEPINPDLQEKLREQISDKF